MGYLYRLVDMAVAFLPTLALAVVVFLIGSWFIGKFTRVFALAMEKQDLDVSLRTFLGSLIRVVLQILLIISVASMIGVQTTSFIAILGAAGLAVGLALQGSLSNFAGGVLILIFRPFKVGDVIEAMGRIGEVKEIQIFCTILMTGDGKKVILPNGALSNGTIVNATPFEYQLVQINAEFPPNISVDKVRQVSLELMQADNRILKTPAPVVQVATLKTGSIILTLKSFTSVADNASVGADLNEKINAAYVQNGFNAPEVHHFVHQV